MTIRIEIEQKFDGHPITEVLESLGAMAYGVSGCQPRAARNRDPTGTEWDWCLVAGNDSDHKTFTHRILRYGFG